MRRMLTVALLAIGGCYLALVISTYVLQDSLVYFPGRDVPPPERAGVKGVEEVSIAAEDGTKIHGWFLAPGGAPPVAYVLLFHGNAGSIADRAWKLEKLAKSGFAAFIIDYRGYGKSEGHPTEGGLYLDGRAAARWARERAKGAPLIFYGESLGCAIAIETALADRPAGLVLETPFTSLAAVGRHHYPFLPISLLLRARYDNLSKIARVGAPLLVIHGEVDRLLPVAMGKAIFDAAAEPKRLHLVPSADHNECLYFDAGPLLDGLREMAAAATAKGAAVAH